MKNFFRLHSFTRFWLCCNTWCLIFCTFVLDHEERIWDAIRCQSSRPLCADSSATQCRAIVKRRKWKGGSKVHDGAAVLPYIIYDHDLRDVLIFIIVFRHENTFQCPTYLPLSALSYPLICYLFLTLYYSYFRSPSPSYLLPSFSPPFLSFILSQDNKRFIHCKRLGRSGICSVQERSNARSTGSIPTLAGLRWGWQYPQYCTLESMAVYIVYSALYSFSHVFISPSSFPSNSSLLFYCFSSLLVYRVFDDTFAHCFLAKLNWIEVHSTVFSSSCWLSSI